MGKASAIHRSSSGSEYWLWRAVKPASAKERTAAAAIAALSYLHPVSAICGLGMYAICKYDRSPGKPRPFPVQRSSAMPQQLQVQAQSSPAQTRVISYPKPPQFFDPTLPPASAILRNPNYLSTVAAPADAALAGLPNGGNTCFLAALTQAFLGADVRILQAAQAAEKHATGDPKRALKIVSDYLETYQNCSGKLSLGKKP